MIAYYINTAAQFYMLGALVGSVMGGIQSLFRSTYAKLIPDDTLDHASYFSFYDVTEKLAIVFGTFAFGYIEEVTESMRSSAAALGVFFAIGLLFMIRIKNFKGIHAG
jgi:UMF1 family MFS transporter